MMIHGPRHLLNDQPIAWRSAVRRLQGPGRIIRPAMVRYKMYPLYCVPYSVSGGVVERLLHIFCLLVRIL
jgi:hypothetical protein